MCMTLLQSWKMLFIYMVPHIALATAASRIISGTFNFMANRKFVFRDKGAASRSFPRYLAVFFLVMFLSAGIISGLYTCFGWNENLTKIPVDTLLFFLSYGLQQRWVFNKKK